MAFRRYYKFTAEKNSCMRPMFVFNAAKVFTNWFLSPKGQLTLQKISDGEEHHNSGRVDVPKDDVDADHKLVKGRKYWDQNQAEWSDVEPIHKLAKEIMKTRN